MPGNDFARALLLALTVAAVDRARRGLADPAPLAHLRPLIDMHPTVERARAC